MAREVARTLAGEGALVQVNTQENPQLAARFGIRGIPAFVALKGGREVARISGTRPAESLREWFRSAVR